MSQSKSSHNSRGRRQSFGNGDGNNQDILRVFRKSMSLPQKNLAGPDTRPSVTIVGAISLTGTVTTTMFRLLL